MVLFIILDHFQRSLKEIQYNEWKEQKSFCWVASELCGIVQVT